MNQPANAGNSDPSYQTLYRLGGMAAFIAAALTLSEVILFVLYPQPGTVIDWFLLFQSNPILGLLDFWGLEVPLYMMYALVFLALHVLLRKDRKGPMEVALILALLGIGIFLSTNNPFAMLSLSDQHAAAATEAQRTTLLAAGQTILANTNQRAVGGFNMGLFLVSIAGLSVSCAMLQSNSLRRSTAIVGILAHTLSLTDYLRQALTSSPTLALLVILPNALLLVTWYVLVGRSLYRLADLAGKAFPKRKQLPGLQGHV